jgi:ribosomal protein S18 acetylase RimI-like enzyme
LRSIGDVIAGHQSSGEFNPRFWFVLSERDMPRGVVLLNRVPRTDTAELVYFGLAPVSRRHGLGDVMMRHALWGAREMNLSRLTLAVDSNNAPALRLYYRHGMQRIGSKVALMRDLRPPRPAPPADPM